VQDGKLLSKFKTLLKAIAVEESNNEMVSILTKKLVIESIPVLV